MPFLPTVTGDSAGVATTSDQPSHDGGSRLGEWSPLIGIITAIVGNILIALALNVQRYSHIQLQRKRVEARERAKGLKRSQSNGHNGYGAIEAPSNSFPTAGSDDDGDDTTSETHPLAQSFRSNGSNWTESSTDDAPEVASTYLKSPSWWLGQVLMTVGESGNFLAYGFAPASIVSPLGVVALISNCVIAPIFFGEIFRKRDFWGVVIAVGGAVTVVLSAKGGETKLDPHDVWDHITTTAFEIYMGVTTLLIIGLMWASPRYGNRTILIDLGLVGLFGGYTALTTKGVSSMLSSTLLKAFTTPVTYGLLVVLLGTAVMQVRYVNKALQRFDSTQVIPIQFVLFTLSVIIGSAVLYRDFERTGADQAAKFIGGCLLTFFGVFLITSGRLRQDDGDGLSDDDDIEETIGLRNQEGYGPYDSNTGQTREASGQAIASSSSSRRLSRTSVGSLSCGGRSSISQQSIGTLPNRSVDQPVPTDATPFLLDNPWNDSVEGRPRGHPPFSQAVSTDTVPTIHSLISVAVSEPIQSSTFTRSSFPSASSPERPVTPRLSTTTLRTHNHHYANPFISPSPLSSTVSAVVSDTLLKGEDSPEKRRRSMRGLRPSIRSSLFVSHDDNDDAEVSDSLLVRNSGGDQIPNEYGPSLIPKETSRGRARSLSNKLGQLFGRRERSRGNSTPE